MNTDEEKALARISIGELDYVKQENVLTPFYRCYVITTAGQIWDVVFDAFRCSKEAIKTAWNTERHRFTKREVTTTIGI